MKINFLKISKEYWIITAIYNSQELRGYYHRLNHFVDDSKYGTQEHWIIESSLFGTIHTFHCSQHQRYTFLPLLLEKGLSAFHFVTLLIPRPGWLKSRPKLLYWPRAATSMPKSSKKSAFTRFPRTRGPGHSYYKFNFKFYFLDPMLWFDSSKKTKKFEKVFSKPKVFYHLHIIILPYWLLRETRDNWHISLFLV